MTRVVTFYSYKGGVGRTMALVNVAHALAYRGLRVLMVDLDLEAPGMTHFFVPRVATYSDKTSKDALDLLLEVKRICLNSEERSSAPVSIADYVNPIPIAPDSRGQQSPYLRGRLDLLPAPLDSSSASRGYLERLADLDLPGIFADNGLGHRFGDEVRRYLEDVRFDAEGDASFTLRSTVHASYDLILIDSRTGLNESSGLCIGPLCDALVVCTGLNEQNVAGTEYFLREAGLFDTQKSKKYAVVVGPIPPWSRNETAVRLERIRAAFHVAQSLVQVPYHPAAALGEPIFVTEDPGEPISLAYETLASKVIELTEVKVVKLPKIRHATPDGWDQYQEKFARILPAFRLGDSDRGESKSPRPFPTAVALDALATTRSHSPGAIAVAVAVAAAHLNSRSPFERVLESGSDSRGEDLSGNLLFMRLRLLDRLPLDSSEQWAHKLLDRKPHSETHELALAYAAGLGVAPDHKSDIRSSLMARNIMYLFEPPLMAVLDGIASDRDGSNDGFLEGFFRGELPEKVRARIAASVSVLNEEYFDAHEKNRNYELRSRSRHLPPGLWPLPFVIGILALSKGVDAIDEILRWLELCRLVHGYAWRVLVDHRHLAPISKHPRFVAFVEEEDQRVGRIERAIDSGEYAL